MPGRRVLLMDHQSMLDLFEYLVTKGLSISWHKTDRTLSIDLKPLQTLSLTRYIPNLHQYSHDDRPPESLRDWLRQ